MNKVQKFAFVIAGVPAILILANCFTDIEYPPDTWEEYMGYYSSTDGALSSGGASSGSGVVSSSSVYIGAPSFWSITTDREDRDVLQPGTSTVGNTLTDGNYVVLVQDGGETVAKLQNYSLGEYLLTATGYPYSSHIELKLGIVGNSGYQNIFSCNSGFTYEYKGSAHRFAIELSTVTDGNDFYVPIVEPSADWKTVSVLLNQLNQAPDWGIQVSRDISKIENLFWQVRGCEDSSSCSNALSAKTGDLSIKNIGCMMDSN